MILIPDVRGVWHRLWSVRLSLAAAALGALDAALPLVAPAAASWRFAAIAAGVSLAAALARLVAQPKLRGDHE